MKQFKDKVAVITGGASGIGLALARRSAVAGMQVVLADIEDAALAAAAGELRSTGARVLTVKCDVSRAADVENLATQTLKACGGVHLVCNNAGVGGVRVKTWEASAKDWQWVLGVNVWGVIHGVRVFTPIMLRQGEEGHIVNTASAAGFVSMASTAPYAVSKHSVVTLSEVLYHDLKAENAKVGVSVLCPAWVGTNIWNAQRNRPAELLDHAETEEERARREEVRKVLERGKVTAADVAEMTFDAVANDRFYIFPHPKIRKDIRTRMEDILELRNPTRTA
jgi:NAD(P)-dependent dehydrogenase (short-subunit alcohol dehydrogenase family)